MTDNEKTVPEKLYDELRAELSTTQLNCDMWHDRAEDMRNRLSAAQVDNAKLREELADAPKCETCEAMLDCDECLRADGSHKERRRLNAENAKLREWCSDFWKWADPPFALKSGTFDEYMALVERAVELGVIK